MCYCSIFFVLLPSPLPSPVLLTVVVAGSSLMMRRARAQYTFCWELQCHSLQSGIRICTRPAILLYSLQVYRLGCVCVFVFAFLFVWVCVYGEQEPYVVLYSRRNSVSRLDYGFDWASLLPAPLLLLCCCRLCNDNTFNVAALHIIITST